MSSGKKKTRWVKKWVNTVGLPSPLKSSELCLIIDAKIITPFDVKIVYRGHIFKHLYSE